LLCNPGRGWMIGHVEMEYLASAMFQHKNTNSTRSRIVETTKKSTDTI
jgi:hypothetical protein